MTELYILMLAAIKLLLGTFCIFVINLSASSLSIPELISYSFSDKDRLNYYHIYAISFDCSKILS